MKNRYGLRPLDRRLAGEVRAEMARQRRSVVEVANEIGIPRDSLNNRLNERAPFRIGELDLLAKALKLPLLELVSRAKKLPPTPASRKMD